MPKIDTRVTVTTMTSATPETQATNTQQQKTSHNLGMPLNQNRVAVPNQETPQQIKDEPSPPPQIKREAPPSLSRESHGIASNRIPGFYACIATMTLGPPESCSLLAKMRIVSDMKFQAIELYWPDFNAFTLASQGRQDWDAYIATATLVRHHCNLLNLKIASIQPLYAESFLSHLDQQKVQLWRKLARILNAGMIGAVPISQDGELEYKAVTAAGSLETLLNSLQDVDVGYEAICFSRACSSWEKAYEDVRQANQQKCQKHEKTVKEIAPVQNRCKIIMDTFNICARVFTFRSEYNENLCCGLFDQTLENIKTVLSPQDVGLIQVADGEKFMGSAENALSHECETDALKVWSRNYRCLPLSSDKGCLPIVAVLKALTDRPDNSGYRGYVSLEVFQKPTVDVPREAIRQVKEYPLNSMGVFGLPSAYALWSAQQARKSWVALCNEMNWEVDCRMPDGN